MKEYRAESGGRYTFVEDFLNLQELALSYSSLIAEAGDCVISGCRFVGDTVTPGYVLVDGKIRKFIGANLPEGTHAIYIGATQTAVNTPYANGENKLGTVEYGCFASLTPPVSGSCIILERGSNRGYIDEEFYAKKMLMLHTDGGTQTLQGNLNITGDLDVTKVVTTMVNYYKDEASGAVSDIYADALGTLHINVSETDVTVGAEAVTFTVEGKEMLTIDKDMVIINGNGHANFDTIKGSEITTSSISSPSKISKVVLGQLIDKGVFDSSPVVAGPSFAPKAVPAVSAPVIRPTVGQIQDQLSDRLEINLGAAKESPSVTVIGNGQGDELIKVDGTTDVVELAGARLDITTKTVCYALEKNAEGKYTSVMSTYSTSSTASPMAFTSVGMVDRATSYFQDSHIEYSIYSKGSIRLHAESIELEGRMFYNGNAIESQFAQKTGGLSQFVTATKTAAQLRKDIGAASLDDIKISDEVQQRLDDLSGTISNDVKERIDGVEEDMQDQIDGIRDILRNDVANGEFGFQNIIGKNYTATELRRQLGAVSREEATSDTGWLNVDSFDGFGSAKIRCLNKVIYLKVSCVSWFDDTTVREFAFPGLSSIPLLAQGGENVVLDCGGGVCLVTIGANERKFTITRCTQSNVSEAALKFTTMFL